MAYFCKIENFKVSKVVKVSDNIVTTEQVGIEYLRNLQNELEATWVQTFKDGTRKNFGGIGYTYSIKDDAFIAPKPYPSWVLVKPDYVWQSPIGDTPETYNNNLTREDGTAIRDAYRWNEQNQTWDLINE